MQSIFNSKVMLFFAVVLAYMSFMCHADKNFDMSLKTPMGDKEKVLNSLNVTTGGPYTYSQSAHHFYGTAYDGSWIDTYDCCCGASGSCRNNPSCQCEVNVGPLPQGGYTLGNMETFKGMPYCYQLYPDSSNNMCGRSGFLIHGGGCSGNPSEGCIVIESESTRYKIKSGARLTVVA
mmetsp:Transcript_128269/g.251262  ORF Transcript_128269/g.251262 Transcript_128269/m.251262 type:complete len:177 (+) Transcript_128269:88-618(+)